MSARGSQSPKSVVKEIRRNTRRKYTSEGKIRIVLDGLKGEVSITETPPEICHLDPAARDVDKTVNPNIP